MYFFINRNDNLAKWLKYTFSKNNLSAKFNFNHFSKNRGQALELFTFRQNAWLNTSTDLHPQVVQIGCKDKNVIQSLHVWPQ